MMKRTLFRSTAILRSSLGRRTVLGARRTVRAFSSLQEENTYEHILHHERMNKKVLAAEYAVRGRLVQIAGELETKLAKPDHGLPFDAITYCNIGNPQSVGQKPLTFIRQVMSLCMYPDLLNDEHKEITAKIYPKDAIARAQLALAGTPGGFGAYSHSKGCQWVREAVKAFVEERDGVECDIEDLFLVNGASDGISRVLEMLVRHDNDGIMIPIPQYPLYAATLSLLGGKQVPYYLDEDKGWGCSVETLKKSVEDAKAKGIETRAMVVINPGNPTGQTLSAENVKDIIHFCHENSLVLLADEVYQSNIYRDDSPFVSFKKVLVSMGSDYSNFELFSFHSTSKGFLGECGMRGGFMEGVNMHSSTQENLYKLMSISLCPNLAGQITTGVMVNPPKPGDDSYALYAQERDTIVSSLQRRALKLVDALNNMEGVSCNNANGAMYVFPKITLSDKAIAEAKKLSIAPDVYYCEKLLNATGVCVVPGSGFQQVPGTWHFRTTFLPQEDAMENMVERMAAFHADFMDTHR